jgi:hypothetical protein
MLIENLIPSLIKLGGRPGSEHAEMATKQLVEARDSNSPVNAITLICPNFEIKRIKGEKKIEIHDSFVLNDYSRLRRGFAAMEEIATIHGRITSQGARINHSLIIIDNAIQWQPEGAEKTIGDGIAILQTIANQLIPQNEDSKSGLKVEKLSTLTGKMKTELSVDFDAYWQQTSQALTEMLDKPNDQAAGIIRREVSKETRYLMEVWGVKTKEEAQESLIRDQYALTATVGRTLPQIHAANWGEKSAPKRSTIILFDAINGPKEDPHNAEYAFYNLSSSELDQALAGLDNSPLPIVRIINNVALWSDRALEAPITGKTRQEIEDEALELSNAGIIPS